VRSKSNSKNPLPPHPDPDSTLKRKVRRSLLAWYDLHRRDLPWRAAPGHKPNPYHVLVSEAMLVQTQVTTVVDYFGRFMVEFPTIKRLEAADEQQVLRAWQGLGYYRRARHLHAAAKQIVLEFSGQIPPTVEQLMQLPGIGRYTAGAIASIAFGCHTPVLDGNVARVLARLLAIQEPIDPAATRNGLWAVAGQLVSPSRPGDFNQAVMDLGAMVCVPRKPLCLSCPLKRVCVAHQTGQSHQLPARSARRQPKPVEHHILSIQRNGRYLFQQRSEAGLWSKMWQLPTMEDPLPLAHARHLQDWAREALGLNVTCPRELGAFNHRTTHLSIRFVLWHARAIAGRLRPGTGQWRNLNKLDNLPLPNPQRKAVEVITGTLTTSKITSP